MKNDAFTFFDQIPFQDLGGGVRRKILAYCDEIMQAYLEFETGRCWRDAFSSTHSVNTYSGR